MTRADRRAPLGPGEEVRIPSPVDLRRRVRITGSGPLEDEAVRNAERALARLSSHFGAWMETEIEAMASVRAAIHAEGLTVDNRERLFHVAHDLRGEAATFGYPQTGRIAGSLARLLEGPPQARQIPLELIDHHVDGVRAAVAEGTESRLAATLADELELAVGRFLESGAP